MVNARLLLILALIAGCASGDSVAPPPVDNAAPHRYCWNPPPTFADNSELVPERDVREWEVFASPDGQFDEESVPVAIVSALDNEARLVTSIDLLALVPFGVRPGSVVAAKAVSTDNVGSGFGAQTTWE